MAENNGFIKLYRSTFDNPIVCKDSDHLAVWIYLLCEATHKERAVMFSGKKITLKAGELTTGRKRISAKLKISESKVQRILKLFESEQQIEQRTDKQCRLISIVNWDEYQVDEQRNEQQMNNDRTTSEQRVNTKQECKNVKNERNKTNIEEILEPIDKSLHPLFYDYLEVRKANKMKDTIQAMKLLVTALQKESNGDVEYSKAIIEQSILKNYKSFFPVKDYKEKKKLEKSESWKNW